MESREQETRNACQQLICELEKSYVQNTYEEIANEFSETRYRAWPRVREFVLNIPSYSLLLDVGCGNGKNLLINPSLMNIACDASFGFLEICKDRGLQSVQANCLSLPFQPNLFDACICIAVLHHLASEERRLNTLNEISKLMRVGARCLVYVWAFEQKLDGKPSRYIEKRGDGQNPTNIVHVQTGESHMDIPVHISGTAFKHQDMFVPWKGKKEPLENQKLRFYHLFRENELEKLIEQLGNHLKVEESFYDNGNWAVIFKKISN